MEKMNFWSGLLIWWTYNSCWKWTWTYWQLPTYHTLILISQSRAHHKWLFLIVRPHCWDTLWFLMLIVMNGFGRKTRWMSRSLCVSWNAVQLHRHKLWNVISVWWHSSRMLLMCVCHAPPATSWSAFVVGRLRSVVIVASSFVESVFSIRIVIHRLSEITYNVDNLHDNFHNLSNKMTLNA